MTIEVPTPSAELLAQIETATIEADSAEVAAVKALREKYAAYARHNGYVKTSWHAKYHNHGGLMSEEEEWYTWNGRKVKALLVVDNFSRTNDTEFTGDLDGERVYLTDKGTWIELSRSGHFSQWQGSPQQWDAEVRELSDDELMAGYNLGDVLRGLGQALAKMSEKLPERYGKLKARTELAQRTLEALK